MLALDSSLFSALATPCLGAFIGYLTNKIAIRMLFRPLRPWHVFGIRVPMTPGVIPAKRHVLATNIGEMVGRHLLTSKDIGAALSEEPFQDHLSLLIERRVEALLKQDLGPVPTIVPRRFKAYFQIGIKTLKYQLGEGVNMYLASSDFAEKITAALLDRLQVVSGKELNAIVSPAQRQDLYLVIDAVCKELLSSQGTEHWLAGYLAGHLRQSAAQGQTLGTLVPAPLIDAVKNALRTHSAPILEQMGAQLAEPVLRAQVVKGILAGVDHFLESLGPVGAMARGFLETETLAHKVGAYLDDKQDDLIAWLSNPEVQERLSVVLVESVDALLAKPLVELLAGMEEERLAELCRACAVQVLAVCRTEETLTGLRALLHVGMENLLDGGRRSLADLADQFFPAEKSRQAHEALIRECVALFRSGKTERLVNSMVHAMVDTLLTRPVGKLAEIVPHGVRQGLHQALVHATNRMFLQEAPGVVDSLNIQGVVTEKVNSLDLLQLERLLLSIMEEQFKYINLFGALLGFLIGLINLAVLALI